CQGTVILILERDIAAPHELLETRMDASHLPAGLAHLVVAEDRLAPYLDVDFGGQHFGLDLPGVVRAWAKRLDQGLHEHASRKFNVGPHVARRDLDRELLGVPRHDLGLDSRYLPLLSKEARPRDALFRHDL